MDINREKVSCLLPPPGPKHSTKHLKKSSCPEQIEIITEDYFVQHMTITTLYNEYN